MTAPTEYRETLTHSPVAVVWMRQQAGLSQRGLAKTLQISSGYMNDIETGRRSAPMAMIEKLAVIFDCPVELLMAKAVMHGLTQEGDV